MIFYITLAGVIGFFLGLISQLILRRFHKICALSIPVLIFTFFIIPSFFLSITYNSNCMDTLENIRTYLFNECKFWVNWFVVYTFLGSVLFYPLEKGFKKFKL